MTTVLTIRVTHPKQITPRQVAETVDLLLDIGHADAAESQYSDDPHPETMRALSLKIGKPKVQQA